VVEVEMGAQHDVDLIGVEPLGPEPAEEPRREIRPRRVHRQILAVADAGVDQHHRPVVFDDEGLDHPEQRAVGLHEVGGQPIDRTNGVGRGHRQQGVQAVQGLLDDAGDRRRPDREPHGAPTIAGN
jgi:hypothetical protein